MNFYEYFNFYKGNGVRAVAVITDKQSVFRVQDRESYEKDEKIRGTHNEIAFNIEKDIGCDAYLLSYNRENCTICFLSNYIVIYLPIDEFSFFQKQFISNVLNALETCYSENAESDMLKAEIYLVSDSRGNFQSIDIKEIREKLEGLVEKTTRAREERMIGETNDEETLKKGLVFNIGIESCSNLQEICSKVILAKKIYDDEYYHDLFCEVFPNFDEIYKICSFLNKFDIQSISVESINFNNLKQIVFNGINHVFDNINSINDLLNMLYKIRSSEEIIKQHFPNFEVLISLINELYKNHEINDELIQNSSGYNDISKKIIGIAYRLKKEERDRLQNELELLSGDYFEMEKEDSAFDIHIELFFEKREKERDITGIKEYMQTLECEIENITEEAQEFDLVISSKSKNFFQRMLNRRKIRKYELSKEQKEKSIKKLKKEQERKKQEIKNIEKELLELEIKFRRETGLDMSLDEYSSKRENEDIMERVLKKRLLKKEIEKNKDSLSKIDIELNELKEIGEISNDSEYGPTEKEKNS